MAITITGVKVTPVDADRLIIIDSQNGDQPSEILFGNLGVSALALTDTTAKVKTYTLYSDIAETNILGTFVVTDGNDGTGLSIGDYSATQTYMEDELTVTANRSIVRSIADTNLGNTPPTGADDDVNWMFIHNNFVAAVPDPFQFITASQLVEDGVEYIISPAGGGITLTIDGTVNSFSIRDYNNLWTDANAITVDFGTDQIVFGYATRGIKYEFRRHPSNGAFFAYGDDGFSVGGTV